jgi:hypothetical protein
MTTAHEDADEALRLVGLIRPLLAHQPTQVQGAVLADLLAMWLAGHVMLGDKRATNRLREDMLKAHLIAVSALIDPNYKASVEPQIKAKTQ